MKITISGFNLKITNKIRTVVYEKLGTGLIKKYLKKFSDDVKTANLTIRRRNQREYKLKFKMTLPGKVQIFAEEKGEKLIHTLTMLRENLERQIKKYKSKIKR